jgi:hypothetical protein
MPRPADTNPHWETLLPAGLVPGRDNTVSVVVNPDTARGSMVVVATRLRALFGALAPRDVDGRDPLAGEDEHDLLRLLDHLHRVRLNLHREEERVLSLLAARGVEIRRIASALETREDIVRTRLLRIELAATRGYSAAGEAEDL